MTSSNSTNGAASHAHASLGYSLALLFALGTLWGGITVMARVVALEGVPALGYAFWQTSGAGVILLLVCLARRRPPPAPPARPSTPRGRRETRTPPVRYIRVT